MKTRTLRQIQQPHHIDHVSVQSPLSWMEGQKTPDRSRLADSFRFMMNLIDAEPYVATTPKRKPIAPKSQAKIAFLDAWQSDFQPDYAGDNKD